MTILLLLLCMLLFVSASWPASMYRFAIAEIWLNFIHTNRFALQQVPHHRQLAVALVEHIDRLGRRFDLNSGLSNESLTDQNLKSLKTNLRKLDGEYKLELKEVDILLTNLRIPFVQMMDAARPKVSRLYRFGNFISGFIPDAVRSGKPQPSPLLEIPKSAKQLMEFPKTMEDEVWVPVTVRLVGPLLIVLETARKIGCTDYKLLRKIYREKFEELYPVVLRLAMAQSGGVVKRLGGRMRILPTEGEPAGGLRANHNQKTVAMTVIHKETATRKRTVAHKENMILGESPKAKAKPIDHSAIIITLKKRLSALWDESGGASDGNLRLGIPGAFCFAKEFRHFKDTQIATEVVMDSVLAKMVHGQKAMRAIPSRIWEEIKREREESREGGEESKEKAYSYYRRAKITISREPKVILFPISMGNYWMLTAVRLEGGQPASLTLYNPLSSADEKLMRWVADAVLGSIDGYHKNRVKISGGLELNEHTIVFNLPGWTTKRPTDSSGLVLEFCKHLVDGSNPIQFSVHWQVASLQSAINFLS